MNTVIYTNETIAFDQLGYDLICERAVKDLTTLLVVAIALAYWVYTTVKPHVVNFATLVYNRVKEEIQEFDGECLKEAVQDLVQEPKERIGYTYTTLRTYWLQLTVPAHEEDWKAFEDLI